MAGHPDGQVYQLVANSEDSMTSEHPESVSSTDSTREKKKHEGRDEKSSDVYQTYSKIEEYLALWKREWHAPRRLRKLYVITAAIFISMLILAINAGWSRPLPSVNANGNSMDSVRIAKVSMLFGRSQEAYSRALMSHERHAARWGYPSYVLKRDEGCGYWTKLVYLMSILGSELQKDPKERMEWLMWHDADSIILNPNIPLSVFLPPADIPHVHFIGSRDENGLNNGVFFLRIHPWAVSMLTSALSFPMCHTDVDLGHNVEQEAMRLTFARPSGGERDLGWRSGVVYMPRVWFNTYERGIEGEDHEWEVAHDNSTKYPGHTMHHFYEGHKGDMLVHFPGVAGHLRESLMLDWLDLVEDEFELQYGAINATLNVTDYQSRNTEWASRVNATNSHMWNLALEQTDYVNKTTTFWSRYRRAMDVVKAATSSTTSIDIAMTEAALDLRVALSEDADNPELIEEKIRKVHNMVTSQ